MNIHVCQSDLAYLKEDDLYRVLKDIKAFGFSKVRWEVPFHEVYAWDGKKNWASVVRVISALNAVGLDHLPVLGAHKPLINKNVNADIYADFCVTAIGLMKNNVADVETWNEPNLLNFWPKADPATFLKWQQKAYAAIKSTYPNVRVLHGGLAAADTPNALWRAIFGTFTGWNKNPVSFLDKELELARGTQFFDVLGYHPYSLDAGFKMVEPSSNVFGIKQIQGLRKIVRDDMVFTEVGFHGNGDQRQLDWLTKHFELIRGFETYLYCWRDTGGETYGLVDSSNRPKDPYYDGVLRLIHA